MGTPTYGVDYTVGRSPHMETIQVVLDTKLLKAADVAAKRQKVNRSALIRQALQAHLKRLRELELEQQDRRGYMSRPQREEEFRIWEDVASWPER
jgi:metal-responsive CopG/Arc/MetJ family transcriptional regulator